MRPKFDRQENVMHYRKKTLGPKSWGGVTNTKVKPNKKHDTPPPKIKRQKRDEDDTPDHVPNRYERPIR